MRWLVAAAIYCSWTGPVLASAECRSEAIAALQRGATSGPFRYESQTKHPNPSVGLTRGSGVIAPPDMAHTKMEFMEEIHIGGRTWIKTPLSDEWRVLEGGGQSINIASELVPNPDRIEGIKCLGEVIEDGRPYIAYEYELQTDVHPQWSRRLSATWKVLVDQATRVPVKIVRHTEINPIDVVEAIETRVYEAGLKVERPDRRESWTRRVERFRTAAMQASPECRKEALSILLRTLTSGPFRVDFRSGGRIIESIVMAPPDGMHFYGERSEQIFVSGQVWSKIPRFDWRGSLDDSNTLTDLMNLLLPETDFVGAVQCLGEVGENGRLYRAYEYEKTSTYPDAIRKRVDVIRRMLVDPATGLPYKFESRDPKGVLMRTELWTFDSNLKVEAPGQIDQK